MTTPFPDVIRIEPAGLCNFHCIHCPVGVEGGRRKILQYPMFVRFLDSLPAVPRVLVLYHGGEPMLNRKLEKMIAYAKEKGVERIVFNTNASLLNLTRDWSQVDEMRVSFDGADARENDTIRVGSSFHDHAEVVRALAFHERRPKVIKIYSARYGSNEIADYITDYFADCPGMEFEGVQIRKWARVENRPKPTNGATYCRNLFETFTILSDGSVPMCCEDLMGDDLQGSVLQNTPLELWERMETRRQAFARQEYPQLCRSCWVTTGVA